MRAKDRLAELKNLDRGSIYNETVELCTPPDADDGSRDIEEIFKEVEKIRGWINEINDNTRTIKHLFADPTFQTSKNLQDQLDCTITVTNATGLKVCGALRQFEERLSKARDNDISARVTRLQYATTRQLYAEALSQHEAFLQSFRDNQYQLLQEQIRLTNLTISDEECQSLLESKNLSLFVDNLQAETQEARLALRDVEARHQELIKIENSLKEVRDMFAQMSHLIMQQQDLIDTVEYYALQATDYVELGGKQLLQGKNTQRKARKKKISLIICLTVGFLIILLILILT